MRSGYRSLVRFGSPDAESVYGAEIEVAGGRELAPGDTGHIRLWVWALDTPPQAGSRFFVFEGLQLVGEGTTA